MTEKELFLRNLREAGEQAAFNPSKVLLMVLEEKSDEHPWFYDLIEDKIYASDSIKRIWGQPVDTPPLSREEFVSQLTTVEDQSLIERMVYRCISEKKRVEFIFTGLRQDSGEEIRVLSKFNPLLNGEGSVIAIYGTDRLIEVL